MRNSPPSSFPCLVLTLRLWRTQQEHLLQFGEALVADQSEQLFHALVAQQVVYSSHHRLSSTVQIQHAEVGEEVVSLLDGEGAAVWDAHLVDEEDDLVACELVALQMHLFDRDLRVREGVDELNEPVVGQRRVYTSSTCTATTRKVEHA